MTPKEKAKELIDKMYGDEVDYMTEEQAKQCALIAVDEIIASNPIAFDKDDNCIASYWWKEVKQQIVLL
jgi:hypothetical protein